MLSTSDSDSLVFEPLPPLRIVESDEEETMDQGIEGASGQNAASSPSVPRHPSVLSLSTTPLVQVSVGACKCARQGSHLGSLRLSSSAQGPRWGREGGGEGEEEQPLSQPGDLSLQERVLVVLRHTALGNRLLHPVAWGSAVGSPPVILLQTTPAPSWRPFPRPEGDQSGAA